MTATTWTPEQRAAASERAKRPRRGRGEGSIFRTVVNGERVWRATIIDTAPDGSVKKHSGTSADKRTAIERRDKNRRKWLVKQGMEDPAVLRETDQKMWSVEEWLNKWADDQDRSSVQPNTRQRNRGLIKNHINPHIGHRKLLSLTEAHVLELVKETLPGKKDSQGQPLLGSSPIRGVFYILAQALLKAEKDGLIRQSPMKYLTAPSKKRKHKLDLADRLNDIPTLLRYTREIRDDFRTHDYWILACYGLRASERLGLEWSSISNLEKDKKKPAMLTIDRQLYADAESKRLYVKHETKTESGTRRLPMPDPVRQALIRQKKRQNQWKKLPTWNPPAGFENLVFTSETGNAVRQNVDNRAWTNLLKKLNMKPMRGHDMRHLTVSYLGHLKIPMTVVRNLVGHSSEIQTAYYMHTNLLEMQVALDALNADWVSQDKDIEGTSAFHKFTRKLRWPDTMAATKQMREEYLAGLDELEAETGADMSRLRKVVLENMSPEYFKNWEMEEAEEKEDKGS